MTDYQLRIQKGPEPGKIIPLTSASVTIGRDPMVEISIDNVEVSRQHARLARTHAGYQVQDLGSTNGTYLDGVRLGGTAVTLQPGQMLSLGSGVSIIFQIVPDAEDEAEDVVLETMLDMPKPPPAEEPMDVIASAEEVVGIEWSEAVDDIAPAVAAFASEPEMPGFAESGTEILYSTPVPEPDEEPPAPILPPVIEQEQAENALEIESESVRAEPFEWNASAESATILDFDEIETETAVSPPAPQSAEDNAAKPNATIDTPTKPKPNNRRTITILLTILILLCCCACGFLYFMYLIGGDFIIDTFSGAGF